MADRSARRTFGPVVLLGLAAATLAAVAGNKPWAEGRSGQVETGATGYGADVTITTAQQMPLAGALGLVVLACWGVVLVARGRFRRAVGWLAVLAAAGLVVTCAAGATQVQSALTDALVAASGADTASVSLTGWYVAACVGAVVSLAATIAAALWMRHWPEMGTRYDAPSGGAASEEHPTGNLELWKAIDEGRDPTA
jgi:hypothetical protein